MWLRWMDGLAAFSKLNWELPAPLTWDDKIMIISNHKFMSDEILNYTQNHKVTRESVKVGVAYGSDTQK